MAYQLPPTLPSNLGLAGHDPCFPLVQTEYPQKDYNHVDLYSKVNIGTAANPEHEKRHAEISKIDSINKELIISAVIEFQDARREHSLHLSNGRKLFYNFRQILGPTFKDTFDTCHQAQGGAYTNNVFELTLYDWLDKYFESMDLLNQKAYLEGAIKKPMALDIKPLVQRLRLINRMMAYLPGANPPGGPMDPPLTEQELKAIFFKLMPNIWQVEYVKGNTNAAITDPTVTLDTLCIAFSTYENLEKANRMRGPNQQIGRAPFRGGRRGGGARGYGRGRGGYQGGYQTNRNLDYRNNNHNDYRPNQYRRTNTGRGRGNYQGRGYRSPS